MANSDLSGDPASVGPGANESPERRWVPSGYSVAPPASPEQPQDPPSLAELIRRGDPDALAGFREAHTGRVRSYCAELCGPERIEEAVGASFVDFLGRLSVTAEREVDLERVLLQATRSATAGRFSIAEDSPAPTDFPPRRTSGTAVPAICTAIPELLASRANGELPGNDEKLSRHVDQCLVCKATSIRLERAERAFASSSGWEPVSEVETALTAERRTWVPEPPLAP